MIAALSSSRGDVILAVAALVVASVLAVGMLVVIVRTGRVKAKVGGIELALGSNGKSLHQAVEQLTTELVELRSTSATKDDVAQCATRIDEGAKALRQLSARVSRYETATSRTPARATDRSKQPPRKGRART